MSSLLWRSPTLRLAEAKAELATATATHSAALDAYSRSAVDGAHPAEVASLAAHAARAARVRSDWRELVERLEREAQP